MIFYPFYFIFLGCSPSVETDFISLSLSSIVQNLDFSCVIYKPWLFQICINLFQKQVPVYCLQKIKFSKYLSTLYQIPRENPIIMKLDTPQFKALFTEEVNILSKLFKDHGYELRIAGGAVRDLLIGIQPTDLDFATTATPEQMKEIFTKESVRMINANGEKHGTVTPRINDKENFEVTTLRIDVTTDGRHAEVQFTTDWVLDANRRDLTINSMFLGLDGTVYDYFHGYEDLQNKKIVFVGDPAQRIQEDYLRILRYFRFYGRIVPEPYDHDQETLKCIKENAGGLTRISGERIWTELYRILEGNHAGELMETIIDLDLAPYLGLPSNSNVNALKKVWEKCKVNNIKLKAVSLISSLVANSEDFMKFHARVRLSSFDRDLGVFITENRGDKPNTQPLKPYQMLVINTKLKTSDAVQYVEELLKYEGQINLLKEFQEWKIPRFPVTGNMLRDHGVPAGKSMGIVMRKLKEIWADKDFEPSSAELLNMLPEVLDLLNLEFSKLKKLNKNVKNCYVFF